MRDARQILLAALDIDDEYLARWSKSLGVDELLRKAQEHGGHISEYGRSRVADDRIAHT